MMQALQDAKMTPADVDKIILIGGPTRMPMVRQFVESVMGKEPERGIDPMEAVAMGAAVQGSHSRRRFNRYPACGRNPAYVGRGGVGIKEPLIERNTTIPTKKSKVFTTAADYQTAVTIHIV